MKTRFFLIVTVAVLALGGLFAARFAKDRQAMAAMSHRTSPPVTVSAAPAESIAWPNALTAVGAVASYRGIIVRTELEGVVRRIACQSGTLVEPGAALVDLDTSVEDAQLVGLDAQAVLTEQELVRALELRDNGANTPADLDRAQAALHEARSAVAQLRATIAKKHIVAPFGGRLGIIRVYPGQFLARSDAIIELETLDPVYADFTLPQQEFGHVIPGQQVRLRVDAHGDRVFAGKVETIAPRVNDATRTISVRALIPNTSGALLPGMFANIEVVLGGNESAIALPTAAVVYNPYGNFVFVITNGVVQQRFVQTGPRRGNLIAITSGLKPGEQVVTSGQIKLRNGVPVRVDNTTTPSANPSPTPAEG